MLTDTRWRFATGKQSLNRLTATPLNEWRYAFQIPDDVLLVIRMYPSQGYEIYEDKIYTNAASVEIDYIFRPLEPAFPAYFVEALAARLAEEIAISVTNNVTLRGEMVELAARRRAEAMHKDAQGRPNVAIQSRPFIDVRR
ncbi:hypothetical protein [uncultured Paraglaciecola sp.]|uniref:hypothetical protein n=1 Tax=uncultured Paraglaciecola sp. TaxID=1765024 RepID=UPI00262B4279|nr:hypothetical protein [uncultured Paraglaciecola sp.]